VIKKDNSYSVEYMKVTDSAGYMHSVLMPLHSGETKRHVITRSKDKALAESIARRLARIGEAIRGA
jgi:hypothetical protein